MARPRKPLDTHGQGTEVLRLLKKTSPGWERERLLVIKLGLEGELSIREIAGQFDRSHQTIQTWFNLFRKGGLDLLLTKGKGNGPAPALNAEQMALFKAELDKGRWRTAKEAYVWLRDTFDVTFRPHGIYRYLKKLGARLKVPRPCHRKMDPEAAAAFKETFCQRLIDLDLPRGRPVRLWIYDESRYGLAPVVRRVWAARGTEVVVPVEKRYRWGYVFGALQVGGGGSEFLLSPTVNKELDRYFLGQIASRDPGAIHVVVGDGAGFHNRDGADGLPENVRLITLPPYSPELNPVEGLWDQMKDAICNRCFDSLEECEGAIVEFLREFWEDSRRVLSLVGDGYLVSKLNAICRQCIIPN